MIAETEYRRLLAAPSLLAGLNSAPHGEVLDIARSGEEVQVLNDRLRFDLRDDDVSNTAWYW